MEYYFRKRTDKDDVMASYLSDIAKKSLFSREEEKEAFKSYEQCEDSLVELYLKHRALSDVVIEKFENNCNSSSKSREEKTYLDVIEKYEEIKNNNNCSKKITEFARSTRMTVHLREACQAMYPIFTEKHGFLSKQWKNDISRKEKQLNQIKEYIANANLRMVISYAKRYTRINSSITISDHIQEGNLGLMKAIEKFDYSRDIKFITYASWWVKQSISRNIDYNDKVLKLPVGLATSIKTFNRHESRLMAISGEVPTPEEVSKDMNISKEKLKRILEVRSSSQFSIDTYIESEDGPVPYTLIDEDGKSPDEDINSQELREILEKAMCGLLTKQESDILKWRFGFDDDNPLTLQEIADKYNLTRERIRQIESRAFFKLKKDSIVLKKYML